ncbi:HalOD1 output domain-containing protein [Haladaptatus sp. DYF46]|uniref:HalOD1 output domain-containing protein n=1 Tax=Haladaptatus sp. DYF46 TaxID=2886041 RepID=UPI001E33B1DA|nr:HalOD1 output domain-containing protein [Haladaptatus sp. DYF46]
MKGKNPSANSSPDSKTQIIQKSFEWSSISPSKAIVKTISHAKNCRTDDIQPLYRSIDPDALDKVMASTSVLRKDTTRTIMFDHEGYTVTVHSSGDLYVCPVTLEGSEQG